MTEHLAAILTFKAEQYGARDMTVRVARGLGDAREAAHPSERYGQEYCGRTARAVKIMFDPYLTSSHPC